MSRLWLPRSSALQVGLGAELLDAWQPPSTYHFPTNVEYTDGLTGGLRNMFSWGTAELRAAMSPPALSSATGMKACVETTAGKALGQLVGSAITAAVGDQIASMISDVVEGVIEVVVAEVIKTVGQAIGDLVSVIPVLGQVIGIVVQVIVSTVDALTGPSEAELAAAKREALRRATEAARSVCTAAEAGCHNLRATGWSEDGVVSTPADLFRPMAYVAHQGWAQPGTRLGVPFCQTMFFAALCGGEDQGLFWQSRAYYNQFINNCRQKYNDPNLGIPAEAQRRMKMLLNGILASVQNPYQVKGQIVKTDGGRTLFPILVDLLWSFYKDNQRANDVLRKELPGYWDERLLREIAANVSMNAGVLSARGFYSEGPSSDVKASAVVYCNEVLDLIGSRSTKYGFMAQFGEYETALINKFGDAYGNVGPLVTNRAALAALAGKQKRSALVFSKSQADKAVGDAIGVRRLTIPQKVLLVSAGLGGSYLAYRGIKAGVKLVRKRRALRGKKRGR